MKKAITILLFLISSIGAFAQIPDWAINLPKSKEPSMDYLVGIGEGNTYKNAYNEAVCDALRKLILRFGLSVNSNDVMSAVYSGQELTTISRDYNIPPINNVCISQVKQQGVERVYVLFQIPANAMVTNPVFEPFTKCDNKKEKLKNQLYWDKGKYVAWNISGTGYPWNLTDGVEFRYGGIFGIGGYLDLGMDFTRIKYSYYIDDGWRGYSTTTKLFFHYGGGLKIYLYKGIFIDCGYGTINKPTIDVGPSGSDSIWTREPKEIAKEKAEYSHGLLFHAGYNLVTNLDSGAVFFLGLSAGASYDVKNKVFAPSVLLKIGVAFDVGS